MKEEYDAAKKLSKVAKGKRLFKEGKVLEAAVLGYPKAIARLASLAEGEKLYDEGKVLEAANLGYPEAMGEMARNYFEGANGFEKDYAKGIKLAMKAANEGDEVGMFYLGYCYLIGSSVARNYAFALSWYERIEEKNLGETYYNIGLIYHDGGFGVYQDYAKAVEYFCKAVDLGYTDAAFYLESLHIY